MAGDGLQGPQALPDVAPSVGQMATPSLDATGGGAAGQAVGQQLQQTNSAILESVANVKERADRLAALSVDSKAAAWEQDQMYDPQKGAMFQQGQNAFPLLKTIPDAYKTQAQTWIDGLANDSQKAQAQRMLNLRLATMQHSLNLHVGEQTKVYDDQQTSAYVSSESEAALGAVQANDPAWQARVALARDRIGGAVSDWGKQHGLSTDPQQNPDGSFSMGTQSPELKNVIDDHQSQLTVGVLGQLLAANKPDDAKAFLAQAQADGNILPSQVDAANKQIGGASVLGQAQQAATKIMQTSGGDLTKALTAARAINDPDVQERTVAEVKTRFAEQSDAQSAQHDQVFTQAANHVEDTGQRPAAVWASLSLSERNQLDARIKQIREGVAVDPEVSDANFYRLKTLASDPDTQQDFLKTNLMMYKGKMDEKSWTELVDAQSDLRKNPKAGGSGTAANALAGWRTNQSVVDDGLKAAGLDPNPKEGTQDEANVVGFRKEVDAQAVQFLQRTGKAAGPDDIQAISDKLLMKVPIGQKDWWGDAKQKPSFEVGIGDVPVTDRQAIAAALAKNGKPVNDDNIAYWYKQRFAGTNGPK